MMAYGTLLYHHIPMGEKMSKPTITPQHNLIQVFVQKLLDIKNNILSTLLPRYHPLQNNHQHHKFETFVSMNLLIDDNQDKN